MDEEYVSIQVAVVSMGVDESILEPFVIDLLRTNRIDSKVVNGERQFLFDALLKLQEQDPTFGGRKAVVSQLVAPASIARRSYFNRRTLLQSILGGIVGGGIVKAIGDPLTTLIVEPLKDNFKEDQEKRKQTADALDLFDELFGCINDNWSFDLGKIYPTTGYHQDHAVTCNAILKLRPSLTSAHSTSISRAAFSLPVRGDHLVIGGPVSTPVVGRAWQYETIHGSAGSIRRVKKPLLQLPYSFLIDEGDSRISNLPPVAWRMAGNGAAVRAANRLLLNSDNPKDQHFAVASRNYVQLGQERFAVPNTNDLLITRLPNFLSSSYTDDRGNNPGTWGRLVVVQGTHGIGTRAVQLLLTHKGKAPLLAMKAQVSNAHAFQSHFKVSKPELTLEGFHQFKSIEHVRSVPVEVPTRNYAAIRRVLERDFSVLR
jgi:hypothetical protein